MKESWYKKSYMFKVEKYVPEEQILVSSPVEHWCRFNLIKGKCWVCGSKPNKSIKIVCEEWRRI